MKRLIIFAITVFVGLTLSSCQSSADITKELASSKENQPSTNN